MFICVFFLFSLDCAKFTVYLKVSFPVFFSVLYLGDFRSIVSTSAIDCLERCISEMIYTLSQSINMVYLWRCSIKPSGTLYSN